MAMWTQKISSPPFARLAHRSQHWRENIEQNPRDLDVRFSLIDAMADEVESQFYSPGATQFTSAFLPEVLTRRFAQGHRDGDLLPFISAGVRRRVFPTMARSLEARTNMPSDESSDDRIRELIPLLIDVQSRLDQEIRLESLARRYGYSAFHFHRFFSKAIGETPKHHVDRLRLERGAYMLAITDQTVLEIALSVGFNSHESFSRAFKRAYGCSPRHYRQSCRTAQAERLERNGAGRGEGCLLSDVRFVALPQMALLAIRHHGAYADCPTPFQDGDALWNDLADWADRNRVAHQRLALCISYDDPTVTPGPLQRLDACIPLRGNVTAHGRIRSLDFAGGAYAGIEHTGPFSTIDQAYRAVADGVRRSRRHVFGEGPPVQIFRDIGIGGDPAANVTEVYFPVRSTR
jgi:AraC family transcriptional regulator